MAEIEILDTGGMPCSRWTTYTLAPNYFYTYLGHLCPHCHHQPPSHNLAGEKRKTGTSKRPELERSQIRNQGGIRCWPPSRSCQAWPHRVRHGVWRPQMCLHCEQMWPWVGSGNAEATARALAGLERGPSIKCKGFSAAPWGCWLLNIVDGINHLQCGRFVPTASKLHALCQSGWMAQEELKPTHNGQQWVLLKMWMWKYFSSSIWNSKQSEHYGFYSALLTFLSFSNPWNVERIIKMFTICFKENSMLINRKPKIIFPPSS